ncbi:MAG: T9SS type A sorting domain-containing protein [Bacteroidia bacterium]|nr:T9SS type A sorting domain-containing protein [Bacteroidia bacterium]
MRRMTFINLYYWSALFVALLFTGRNSSGQSVTNFGIWNYAETVYYQPYIQGKFAKSTWAELEPTQGTWNFQPLYDQIVASPSEVMVLVYSGTDAPLWIYEMSGGPVPEVYSDHRISGPYPYYPDPEYKTLLKNMIIHVRDFIVSLPENLRNKIIVVQAAYSSTGDYDAYKGNVLSQYSQYDISFTTWKTWWREFTKYYYDAYQGLDPEITILCNPSTNDSGGADNTTWLNQNCPGSMIKSGNLGHCFQLNLEIDNFAWLMPAVNTLYNGQFMRTRCEFDESDTEWWKKAPKWNMYNLLLNGLYVGLDYEFLTPATINLTENADIYNFFNKYAGQKDPVTSPGAFVALRDGLDASDIIRFPAATFGAATQTNTTRYQNIATNPLYAAFGARQDDVPNSGLDGMNQRQDTKALNDVGWRIYTGNYYRYLEQINPGTTSQGYWRVAPAPTSTDQTVTEPCTYKVAPGRFARGFNHSDGKDAMYFKFDNKLFQNCGTQGFYDVNVRIVYYDRGTSAWRLIYDAKDDSAKQGISITNINSEEWKEINFTINDGYFGKRGTNGSDLILETTNGQDAIFHMIEVTKNNITTGIQEKPSNSDNNFTLFQNYPNPFNPVTTIQFALPKSGSVTLKVYNSLGQEVTTLVNEILNGGLHSYQWNAEIYCGGIYFYKLQFDNQVLTNKMILLK